MVDAVAQIVEDWRRERPDVDVTPMLVVGRIHRLAALLDNALRPLFAEAGLGGGEFDVLAALRRAGAPYRRSPSELQASLMVTSGAVSKQVDRLVSKGLVRRDPAPGDGRSRLVSLTESGRRLVDDLLAVHVANEARLLAAVDTADRQRLADLLGELLGQVEERSHP